MCWRCYRKYRWDGGRGSSALAMELHPSCNDQWYIFTLLNLLSRPNWSKLPLVRTSGLSWKTAARRPRITNYMVAGGLAKRRAGSTAAIHTVIPEYSDFGAWRAIIDCQHWHVDGLVQDCSGSSVLAMEWLWFCIRKINIYMCIYIYWYIYMYTYEYVQMCVCVPITWDFWLISDYLDICSVNWTTASWSHKINAKVADDLVPFVTRAPAAMVPT